MRARLCVSAVSLALLILAGVPGSALAAAGQISGTVTDATTGAALAGVEVDVYDSSDDFVASANTDPTGAYTILGLSPGSYKVGFYDNGGGNHLVQFYNGQAKLDGADPVVVASGSATTGINAALAQAGGVAGTVTDAATGSPVKGVDVEVLNAAGDEVGDASTNASGSYSVGSLPTGSYHVEFLSVNDQPYGRQFYSDRSSLASADLVSVTGGKVTNGIDAQLVAGARFSGTVTGAATGDRVPNAQVSVFTVDGTPVTVGEADAAGRYAVGGLAPGPYKLEFAAPVDSGNYGSEYYDGKTTLASADVLTATTGQSTTANGTLGPGAQIDGTVTDADSQQPIAGVDVVAYDSGENVAGDAITQSDGSYQLDGLPSGSYTISFAASDNLHVSDYYNGRSTSSGADPVSVTAGQSTTGIDAALARGGAITGKVADASGAAVGNVSVEAYDTSGTVVDEQSTGPDGHYTLGGLAGGDYRLQFVPDGSSAYTQQFYNGAATLAAATPVSVTLGQTTPGIDAALSGGGSVEGVVTDASTGQGLGDVEVDVSGPNGYATSVTDGTGHYSVGGLTSGTYTASFTDLSGSHVPQTYDGKSAIGAVGDPISVTNGQATSNIDAALGLAGKIDGTVTDAATGKPITGVSVDASSANGDGYATTAADGTYSMGGLPAGTYTVSFDTYGADDHVTQYYNGKTSGETPDSVTVAAGQTTSSIDAAMTTGGDIAGTVTDASTGDPVVDENVTVYDSSGNYVSSTYTAADGSYTVDGLPGGSYRVGFSQGYSYGGVSYTSTFYNGAATLASAAPVPVTSGQTTGNIDETLAPTTGAIAGTVSDAPLRAPVPEASVTVYTTSGAQVGFATTDANGRYRVAGLPAGSYLVGFAASGYGTQFSAAKDALASADPVTVSSGQTTASIDAAMKRQGVIEGTVTGAPNGTSLPGVTVAIVDSYGDWIDSTITDAGGGYAFSGLAAGSYKLEFIPALGTDYLTEYYNRKDTQSTADAVAVSDGSVVQGIDAALPAGGEITGHVTSASTGDPLPNISVSASGAGGNGYGTASTDANGNYTIVGLPTDSYYVSYQDPDGSYLDQPYANNPVTVTAGQTTAAIDGAMQSAAKISGTVTDNATQQPIAGIQAIAYDANGDYITAADTDAEGVYTLSDLPTGSYRVEFSNGYDLGGYLTQYYNGRASLANADSVAATAGQTSTGIDAAMQAGGRVTGTITDASTNVGVANILATVYDAGGNAVGSADTSSSGSYTITGLPTGSYRVGFTDDGSGGDYQDEYYNGRLTLASADAVTVNAGQTTAGIDAAMVTGGKITGAVTDANTHSGVYGANVYVYDANGDYVSTAYTGPNGSYTVTSLPTGSYRLEVVGPGLYVAQYYNGKTTLANADPIAVTVGQTTSKIDVALQNGGVISGSVTDSSTGQPIVGATVYVSGPGAYRSTTTDSLGNYTMSGLTTGSYKVEFSAAGYLSQYYDSRADYSSADSVAVTTGQTASGINASLQLGATITGTVTDAGTGKAIADEPVFAENAGGQVIASANTDASGHYQLIGLATGSYDVGFGVYASGPNYVPEYYNGQQCADSPGTTTSAVQAEYGSGSCTPASAGAASVAATVGQTTTGIDASMHPGAQLTGTVTRADTGAAASQVTVTAYDSSGDFLGETTSAANGTYTLDALPAGTYKVGFSDGNYYRTYLPQYYNGKTSLGAADPITLATAQTATGIDAAMQVGGQITGTVTDAATQQPLTSVGVSAYDSNGNYVAYAYTTSNGTYTLTGLPTGSYRIEFSPYNGGYVSQYYNGKASLSTADQVAVTAGATTSGIDAALSNGGSISGTVTDSGDSRAISGVTVTAYSYSGNSLLWAGSASTDGTGRYTITGLSTGSYRLQFSGAGYLTQVYNSQQSLASGDPVSVSYGQNTSGIDASLVRGATITGTVTDASSGAGVSNASVTVYDSHDSPLWSVDTSSNGSYQLPPLPAGSYKVGFAEGLNQNYLPQYYSGQTSLSTAKQITLAAGQTVGGIDAALQPGGQITGTVTDAATGSPVSGIWVSAWTPGGQYATSAPTGSQGNYSIGGLNTGSYTVEFYAPSSSLNYLPKYYNNKTTLQGADAVSVTVGQATSGINAALQPGGEITGTVVSSNAGVPLAGITVSLSGAVSYGSTTTTTDGSGHYAFNQLPTGSYQVSFHDPAGLHRDQYYDDAATSANATPIAVTAGQSATGIDATLAPAGRITGSVSDAENGGPVSGAAVTLYDAGGNYVASTSTAGTGGYSFEALTAGQYEVSFATGSSGGNYGTAYYNGKSSLLTADPVTVSNEVTTSGVNGQLTSLPVSTALPTISGTAQQGETLTEANGQWTHHPTSYSYQWLRCQATGTSCTWIPNATAQTYTATADDVGDVLEVSETATNAGGPGQSATSAPTSVVLPAPPTDESLPAISGEAADGQTLTETHGLWTNNPSSYDVRWLRCDTSGANCIAIDGATGQTYVPGDADVGHTLVVSESAANAGGAGTAVQSAPTPIVAPPPPTNQTLPTISGTATDGQTLTETNGTWTGSPTSYAYQWLRCDSAGSNCTPIARADAQTYALTDSDVGHTIAVEETAYNADGASQPATSAPTAVVAATVPVTQLPPSITGKAQEGQTLTETHGWWTPAATDYSYQWLRCDQGGENCALIDGATGQTYIPSSADIGDTISVAETAIDSAGDSQPVDAPVTAVVLPAVPSNLTLPAISGNPTQGDELMASAGTWTESAYATTFDVQWLRCDTNGANCSAISGATGWSYLPTGDDVGATLVVSETATNAGGTSAPVQSAATAVLAGAVPQDTAPPSIAGSAVEGDLLTEQNGIWTNQPTGYTYQWLRCDAAGDPCTPIAGATGQGYTPVAADIGSTLEVSETAHNQTGDAISAATSAPTATVVGAVPVSTQRPTISGSAEEGATLSEDHGAWTNSPSSYTYQWLRCTPAGADCTAIAGSTDQTYTLSPDDVDHAVEVQETAVNSAGDSAPVASAPTASIIAEPPTASGPPAITGTDQVGETLNEEHGTWSNAPTAYVYQWRRCDSVGGDCSDIAGATSRTYTLTSDDLGQTLRVSETADNDAGAGDPATSQATAVVSEPGAPAPTNTAPPQITGTPEQGLLLTVTDGTWTGAPTWYRDQWMRCDGGGGACVAIPGADGTQYTLAASDVGHTVVVSETAGGAGGVGGPVQSQPTTAVSAAPVHADAGDSVAGTTSAPVTLDASASTPANLITSYSWQFGDGSTGTGETVQHQYARAGTFTATVTVSTGAQSDTATTKVTITGPPPGGGVRVTTQTNSGAPISAADIAYEAPDGTRIQASTGADGTATLAGLPDGSDTVLAVADGYRVATGQVAVSNGNGSTTLTLVPGQVATASLSATQMTLAQIEAAGIDVNDPANQNVYTFTVQLAFPPGYPAGSGVELCGFANDAGQFVGDTHWCGGGGGFGSGWGCSVSACWGPGVVAVPVDVDGHPLIEWLVLQGQASVLKEFFSVDMMINNLSPDPVTMSGGSATLDVPTGLSLAPTAHGQSASQSVPDIAGDSSTDVRWIIRGDTPGYYGLSATYHGTLQPFGKPVDIAAALAKPLHIWGVEALGLSVQADSGSFTAGQPYHVRLGLTNKADVPLYNVKLSIDAAAHPNYIFQPGQSFSDSVPELDPGQTLYSRTYILVPDAASAGAFDPSLSTATFAGENASPGSGITAVTPPTLYALTAPADTFGMVHLHWDPVPGATGYEVFSTSDLDTPFQVSPDSVATSASAPATTTELPGAATDAYIPVSADSSRYYAVSTVGSDGTLTLEHPVVLGLPDESTPLDTTRPSISGQPIVGDVLTASSGSWQNQPSSYTYQWERCDPAGNGRGCADIPGATSQTYTVALADVGYTLLVDVTADNPAGAGNDFSDPTGMAQGVGFSFTNHGSKFYASQAGIAEGDVMSQSALSNEFADWTQNPNTQQARTAELWKQASGGLCLGLALSAGRFDAGLDQVFDPANGRSDPVWKVEQAIPYGTKSLPGPGGSGSNKTYDEELLRLATDDWASQAAVEYQDSEGAQQQAYANGAAPSLIQQQLESVMGAGRDLYGPLTAPPGTGLALLNFDVYNDRNAPNVDGGSYGHTVLAFGEHMLKTGTLRIDVWDSNFPDGYYYVFVSPDGTWSYSAPYVNWGPGSEAFQGSFSLTPSDNSWLDRISGVSPGTFGYLSVMPLYQPAGLHYYPTHGFFGDIAAGTVPTAAADAAGAVPALRPLSDAGEGTDIATIEYPTAGGTIALSGANPAMSVRGPGEYMTVSGDNGSVDMKVSVDTNAGSIGVTGRTATLSVGRVNEDVTSTGASSLAVDSSGGVTAVADGSGIVTVTEATDTNGTTTQTTVYSGTPGAGNTINLSPAQVTGGQNGGNTQNGGSGGSGGSGQGSGGTTSATATAPTPVAPGSSAVAPTTAPAGANNPSVPTFDMTKLRAALRQLLAAGSRAKWSTLLTPAGYRTTFIAVTRGTLTISWYASVASKRKPVLIATARVSVRGGRTHVAIKLTSAGRRQLRSTRRLTVKAVASFTPPGVAVVSLSRTFVLKR